LIKEAKSMLKGNEGDPGKMYAKLTAERQERRAALVRNALLVDEDQRFLELKERVYATMSESFDRADVEDCPSKRGALIQQATSLFNTYVKVKGLCDQRNNDNSSGPSREKSEAGQ
jgi:hypothetical protein